MTIRGYLQVLRKRWRVMATFLALGVVGGLAVSVAIPVSYEASATSFVAIQRGADDSTSIYQTSQFAMQRVKSYTSVVDSPDVLDPVIDLLGLPGTSVDLRRRVTAENPTDTVLLQVNATAGSAAEAAAIANAVSVNLGKEIERLESPRTGSGVSPVKVSLSVPATPPTAPVAPRKTVNLVLGILVGLALGIAASVVRDTQDTTVRDGDVEDLTGRSPLGVVGYNPDFADSPLVVLGNGPATEEFRTIRTNLQFTDVDNPPRCIVVTSSVASEGKTTVACNLALTLARGASVCLVEADMRLPKVTEYLGLDGSIGLSNLLAGQYELDDVLVPWRRGSLSVLPAGTVPPDPSQLLASNTMTSLLERLRERFDHVIFDAPPVLPVSDAVILASATDGVLFVSRFGATRRDRVERALESLVTVRARLIGTVLTFVPASSHRALRGHEYGYGYGYGYGHGAHEGDPGLPRARREHADRSYLPSAAEAFAGHDNGKHRREGRLARLVRRHDDTVAPRAGASSSRSEDSDDEAVHAAGRSGF